MNTFTADLQVGEHLDHYRIENLVAQSGMASIYRATDLRSGETVAIKIPHFEVESDPLLFDRFRREEEIGIRLRHPGVMQVFMAADRSRVYMVMEWVEGQLLRKVLNTAKKLDADRAVRITIGICEALAYIHEEGVTHRDLKPDNIMVGPDDQIKLIDFGIASNARGRRLTFGNLTRTFGTADYISPEQVKANRSDGRSDVYSAAVILYEMLTGELLFQGATPLAVMNDRILNDPIPPRAVNPDISPQLEEILFRALARDPNDRYPKARMFASDLRHPEKVEISAHRDTQQQSKRRTVRPKTVLVYIGIALIPIIIFSMVLLAAYKH